MIKQEGVRVRIPASTANMGPGFDTLGMALSLYGWIEMKQADETVFHLYGDQMQGLPQDKSNLIYQVAQMVFEQAGVSVPEIEVSMYTEIPLTRGLGSSASAIVGALVAANELIGAPLSLDTLFDMATQLEQHPDNVGASLFGGIITAAWDGEHADYVRIEPHEDLEVLVVIPDFQLSTSEARKVVPQQISREDAVFNISRSSMLVAALASGRFDLLSSAMSDRLHQPYRASLVPGMEQILREATANGAAGIALSGAGPTLLALVHRDSTEKSKLVSYLEQTMQAHGIDVAIKWLAPSREGAIVITDGAGCSFEELIKGDMQI